MQLFSDIQSRQHEESRIVFRWLSLPLARCMVLLLLAMLSGLVQAQNLEPRRWSHLPTGLNVLGLGAGYTNGDILFDPALNIEDATYDLYLGAAVYVRTFELFGKSARVDTTSLMQQDAGKACLMGNSRVYAAGDLRTRGSGSLLIYMAPRR